MIWGQGPDFNSRLVKEINNETTSLQFVIYRLTVDNITDALLAKFNAGVQMQLLIEPNEYLNRKWPEFWLTHANIDKMWAAGIPIKWRIHNGLTHMKTLVTSTYATNASPNYAAALAAGRRLLRLGGGQTDDLPGDQEPRRPRCGTTRRRSPLPAPAAGRAGAGHAGVERHRRRDQRRRWSGTRAVRGQLRRRPRDVAVEHGAGRQRPGADVITTRR